MGKKLTYLVSLTNCSEMSKMYNFSNDNHNACERSWSIILHITHVTGPMKRALNAGILESSFIVESDKAFFKLQNDTKIDLLAVFYPEICSREW